MTVQYVPSGKEFEHRIINNNRTNNAVYLRERQYLRLGGTKEEFRQHQKYPGDLINPRRRTSLYAEPNSFILSNPFFDEKGDKIEEPTVKISINHSHIPKKFTAYYKYINGDLVKGNIYPIADQTSANSTQITPRYRSVDYEPPPISSRRTQGKLLNRRSAIIATLTISAGISTYLWHLYHGNPQSSSQSYKKPYETGKATKPPEFTGTPHNKQIPVKNIDQSKSPDGQLYIYARTEVIEVPEGYAYILSVPPGVSQIGGFFKNATEGQGFIDNHIHKTLPIYTPDMYPQSPDDPNGGEILVVKQDNQPAAIVHVLRSVQGKEIQMDCRVVKISDVEKVASELRTPPAGNDVIAHLNLRNAAYEEVKSSQSKYQFTPENSLTFQ